MSWAWISLQQDDVDADHDRSGENEGVEEVGAGTVALWSIITTEHNYNDCTKELDHFLNVEIDFKL